MISLYWLINPPCYLFLKPFPYESHNYYKVCAHYYIISPFGILKDDYLFSLAFGDLCLLQGYYQIKEITMDKLPL